MQASSMTSVEVVTATTLKMPVFIGNNGDDWTIWKMKMSSHLMEKELDACLDPDIETRLPDKEIGMVHCFHTVYIHFSSSDSAFQRRIFATMQCYPYYIPTSSHSPYI